MINTNFLDIDNKFFKYVRTRVDHNFHLESQVEGDVYTDTCWNVHPINHQQVLGRLWRKVFR